MHTPHFARHNCIFGILGANGQNRRRTTVGLFRAKYWLHRTTAHDAGKNHLGRPAIDSQVRQVWSRASSGMLQLSVQTLFVMLLAISLATTVCYLQQAGEISNTSLPLFTRHAEVVHREYRTLTAGARHEPYLELIVKRREGAEVHKTDGRLLTSCLCTVFTAGRPWRCRWRMRWHWPLSRLLIL